MQSVLDRKVLVLNRVWQLINESTVQDALVQCAGGAATALEILDDGTIRPVSWEEWITLPPLNDDEVIHTQRLRVRMPTVIVAVNYAKVPKRRPKFTLKNIARRDQNRCQYTGVELKPSEQSIDHVLPLSRGGEDVPENAVLAHKDVNNRKGARTPSEAGLPTPKIRKLGVFSPIPTHKHHEIFILK